MVLFDKFYLCFSSCNSNGVEEIEMELITPDINEDAVERVLEGDKTVSYTHLTLPTKRIV